MKLSEKIKLIRETHGYNRVEFAQILSMPKSSLEKYEAEERSPSGKALLKIVEIYPQYALWLITDGSISGDSQIIPGENIPQMSGTGVPAELLNAAFEQTLTTSIELGWITPKEGVNFSMLSDLLRHDFVQQGGRLIESVEGEEANAAAV